MNTSRNCITFFLCCISIFWAWNASCPTASHF